MEYRNSCREIQAAIPDELIEAVRSLCPIEQIAGETVTLRRSGHELIGRCPFHPDRHPSFAVNAAKGLFVCHGCHAGGDIFEFVRNLNRCSFREAVELLAARAGIKIQGFAPSGELVARVSAMKAKREEEKQFERFFRERVEDVGRRFRSLGRAASHAEEYLRTGDADPYLQNLAWEALERFRLFEARIEREGLCDLSVLRNEWDRRNAA